MIVYDTLFDPVRDVAPVDQFGFIDLKVALVSGNVPSQVAESESDYNGIQNPEAILGKPHDIFEAMDAQAAAEKMASENAESHDE